MALLSPGGGGSGCGEAEEGGSGLRGAPACCSLCHWVRSGRDARESGLPLPLGTACCWRRHLLHRRGHKRAADGHQCVPRPLAASLCGQALLSYLLVALAHARALAICTPRRPGIWVGMRSLHHPRAAFGCRDVPLGGRPISQVASREALARARGVGTCSRCCRPVVVPLSGPDEPRDCGKVCRVPRARRRRRITKRKQLRRPQVLLQLRDRNLPCAWVRKSRARHLENATMHEPHIGWPVPRFPGWTGSRLGSSRMVERWKLLGKRSHKTCQHFRVLVCRSGGAAQQNRNVPGRGLPRRPSCGSGAGSCS
mmetsp:Transcript_5594/g.15891  ORF Transcript_5594/g.15891 Transcript_5594/m.15891 type:complete len:311 (+) Transcript_5594:718-1650(+)